ncbi:uncharacterized protein LOC119175036 isoform X1 [Rhipicephalus microplus]|uniref:uncharacterized protein LOC119175036 isoform X1 n=1 Tax=Rhipicephalus microplus TaxID=6941 RepID=UPI003F6AC548
MSDGVEIVKQASKSRSLHFYANGAFSVDALDIEKNATETCGPDDLESHHATTPTKSVLSIIRQSRWMMPLVYTHIWLSAAFSLMQPYFPPLADAAGLEAWKYGFFFSAVKVAMLLGSAISERIMALASPRKCYLSGQIGFLLFTTLLGLMFWSPKGSVFLSLCLTLAVIGGFFSTVFLVSAYAVVTSEFPMHTGPIIATMEFLWGVGNMVGTGLGGVLIDAWAYPLPFFVIAALLGLSLPWTTTSKKLSDISVKDARKSPTSEPLKRPVALYKLLIDPVFVIDMVTVMISWIIMGFNEPTLEPHLRQFGLDTAELGGVYMVQFASYTISSLVVGILCQLKGKRILRRYKNDVFHFHRRSYKSCLWGYLDASFSWLPCRKVWIQERINVHVRSSGILDSSYMLSVDGFLLQQATQKEVRHNYLIQYMLIAYLYTMLILKKISSFIICLYCTLTLYSIDMCFSPFSLRTFATLHIIVYTFSLPSKHTVCTLRVFQINKQNIANYIRAYNFSHATSHHAQSVLACFELKQ